MGWFDVFKRSRSIPEDPNVHVRSNLEFYLNLPDAPHYAIMITGPWGGGKTHLVKNLLGQLRSSGTKHVYVSLYGVGSKEEFDRAVLAALYPFLTNKAVKASLAAIGGLLSVLRVSLKGSIEDYLERFDADVFVFDDLERCDVSLITALGYVNPYVEHGDCKVVLLANEDEVKEDDKPEYKRRKEKVIGQALAIVPDIAQAIPAFIVKIKDREAKGFLQSNIDLVIAIARESDRGNLRVVQQALWDFGRFYKALPVEFRKKTESLQTVLGIFLALAIEFKLGALDADAIKQRSRYDGMFGDGKDKPSAFKIAARKYPGVDLYDTVLTNDLVVELFAKGSIDKDLIISSLAGSHLFTSPAKAPSWRVVWEKELLDDDIVEKSIEDMEAKFKSRSYVERGEILHVFGLRLILSEQGLIPFDKSTVVGQGRGYIDELKAQGKLGAYSKDLGEDFRAHAGLGFSSRETAEFRELLAYLLQQQEEVLQDSYPALGEELLDEMAADDNLFWRRINYSNTGDTRYANTPILVSIPPKRFVDSVLALSASNTHSAMRAVGDRYKHGGLAKELKAERPWLEEVRQLLLEEANMAEPVKATRIRQLTAWTIDKVLKDIEAAEREAADAQAKTD
ncbi:hypothetical protein JHC09_00615 [Devosia sp. MC532]|uniref:P-loop NTPase fold protein n=1 Tax=Devosia sp. MC532 TaxID=2799788 RepID=UPI0018F5CEFA|nr:P-loop NTPase fold protein [Devosia sp. MC532]MBJ7576387.1 hypothetical protein [Devosia sp. MC532]